MPKVSCSKNIANNIKYADILFKMQKKIMMVQQR